MFGANSTFNFGAPKTAASTTPAAPSFGFGTPAPTAAAPGASTGFSFGQPTATVAPSFSGFGTTTTASSTSTFTFPNTTTTAPSAFAGFNQPAAPAAPSTNSFSFNQPQAQQSVQPSQQLLSAQNAAQSSAIIYQAVTKPQIYGDDRDQIIASWNGVQAAWGKGRVFAGQNMFVEIQPSDEWSIFKSVRYIEIPSYKNEEGVICLKLSKSRTEVLNNQKQFCDGFHRILGGSPTTQVVIDSITAVNPPSGLPEKPGASSAQKIECHVMLHVINNMNHVPASDLFNHLQSPAIAQQLQSQLAVVDISSLAAPTREERDYYASHPPAGIAPLIWLQAHRDNPDHDRLLPAPVIGFPDMMIWANEQQSSMASQREVVTSLTHRQEEALGRARQQAQRVDELRQRIGAVGHRLLNAAVKLETADRGAAPLTNEEYAMRSFLEQIDVSVQQLNQRLSEFSDRLSLQSIAPQQRSAGAERLPPNFTNDVTEQLRNQMRATEKLVSILKEDLNTVSTIERSIAAQENISP